MRIDFIILRAVSVLVVIFGDNSKYVLGYDTYGLPDFIHSADDHWNRSNRAKMDQCVLLKMFSKSSILYLILL